MKTKLNFLVVIALVAMLVGGNTTPAQAQTEFSVGEVRVIDYSTDPNTEITSSTVGTELYVNAAVAGYYEGLTCNVDFGDADGNLNKEEEGWLTTDPMSCGARSHYTTAGTFTITVTVTGTDGTSHSSTTTHTVNYTDVAFYEFNPLWVFDPSIPAPAVPSMVNQTVTVLGIIDGQSLYSTESCTVDYGDGGGPETGMLIADDWPAFCQGPEHTYTTAGAYTISVTLSGYNGSTALESISHQVVTPVFEQLSNQYGAVASDSTFCTIDDCSAADNFVVPDGSLMTIDQIQLWGYYNGDPDTYTDDFTVVFHQDNAGLPGEAIYTENIVWSEREATGEFHGGNVNYPEYQFTLFMAGPQTFSAGRYWVEIYNNGGDPTLTPAKVFTWGITGLADTSGLSLNNIAVYGSVEGWHFYSGYNYLALRLLGYMAAEPTYSYSLSGTVFDDQNANGAFDSGESGLSGVEVTLDQSCNQSVESTVNSGSDGSYTFTDLEEGQPYCVWAYAPDGYQLTLYQPAVDSLAGDVTGMDFGFTDQDLFTWAPTTPDEGGSATFTAVGGWSGYEWMITTPDVTCGPAVPGFPDGNGQEVELTFGPSGEYQVCLKMTNADGWPVFAGQPVTVNNVAPAPIEYGTTIYPEPSNVYDVALRASAAFFDYDHLTGCTVDYGDGTPPQNGYIPEEENVCESSDHIYIAAGTYTVKFTVTDSDGGEGTSSVEHTVLPEPSFASLSPVSAVAGSGDLTLTLNGSNFTEDTMVILMAAEEMIPVEITYVSSTELTVIIPADCLASSETILVMVATPGGSGLAMLAFFVTEATAGVSSQDVASGTDPIASVTSVTATATGEGLVIVSEFDANPGGEASFTASGSYFDVYAMTFGFSQVEVKACDLNASDKLFWWDGASWLKADPQSYSDGCITLIVDAESSPNLSQLQGTYFVAGESASNTIPVANPGGPYLEAINIAIAFDGSLSSDADGDALTYAWDFGDGSTGTGVMPSHIYIAAGVYNVCLTVNDGAVDSDPTCTLAVVYDPSAGFVTGGGWIDSQPGAYKLDESLSGKATFGFVSKYLKGASVPTGNTEFQFQAGSFNFRSTSYDWLVVSKDKVTAQFKGSGTINGALDPNGNAYKFLLWAGDGTPDTFRIRIWWEDADGVEHDVYDNGFNQPISGGSIVVHTGK